MSLRDEVTTTLRAAPFPMTASEVRRAIQDRTGHTVKLDTVTNHLRARAKLDGGADIVTGTTPGYTPTFALRP